MVDLQSLATKVNSTKPWDVLIYQQNGNVYALDEYGGCIISGSVASDVPAVVERARKDVSDGKHLHFGPGTYELTRQHLQFLSSANIVKYYSCLPFWNQNVWISGAGRGNTILKLADSQNDANHPCVLLMIRPSGQYNLTGPTYTSVLIEDITFDGNRANQTAINTDGAGLILTGGGGSTEMRHNFVMRHCELKSSFNTGAYLGYNGGGYDQRASIVDLITRDNAGWGLCLDTVVHTTVNGLRCIDDAQDATTGHNGIGFEIMGASNFASRSNDYLSLRNIDIESCAMRIRNMNGVRVSGLSIHSDGAEIAALRVYASKNIIINADDIYTINDTYKRAFQVDGSDCSDIYLNAIRIQGQDAVHIRESGVAEVCGAKIISNNNGAYLYDSANLILRNCMFDPAVATNLITVQSGCTAAIYGCVADAVRSVVNAGSISHAFTNNLGLESSGAASSISDGGTIAHGLYTTPTEVRLTASVAGEIATITSANATNITVAIKGHDGSAGTSQTIYWWAKV